MKKNLWLLSGLICMTTMSACSDDSDDSTTNSSNVTDISVSDLRSFAGTYEKTVTYEQAKQLIEAKGFTPVYPSVDDLNLNLNESYELDWLYVGMDYMFKKGDNQRIYLSKRNDVIEHVTYVEKLSDKDKALIKYNDFISQITPITSSFEYYSGLSTSNVIYFTNRNEFLSAFEVAYNKDNLFIAGEEWQTVDEDYFYRIGYRKTASGIIVQCSCGWES